MSGTVFVVEDDDDVREIMVETLTEHGHPTVAAAGGREAYERLRAGLRPCVILLDVMMPAMSGWELRDVLERDPELATVPVVIVSGDLQAATLAEQRADAYLAKPFEAEELLALVERFCGCS